MNIQTTYSDPNDPVIKHHGSPYYFNGGEILVIVLIRALEVTLGLMWWSAVLITYESIVGAKNVAAAWISLVIVFVIVLLLILVLSHCKKNLMKWAHCSFLFRASI